MENYPNGPEKEPPIVDSAAPSESAPTVEEGSASRPELTIPNIEQKIPEQGQGNEMFPEIEEVRKGTIGVEEATETVKNIEEVSGKLSSEEEPQSEEESFQKIIKKSEEETNISTSLNGVVEGLNKE